MFVNHSRNRGKDMFSLCKMIGNASQKEVLFVPSISTRLRQPLVLSVKIIAVCTLHYECSGKDFES